MPCLRSLILRGAEVFVIEPNLLILLKSLLPFFYISTDNKVLRGEGKIICRRIFYRYHSVLWGLPHYVETRWFQTEKTCYAACEDHWLYNALVFEQICRTTPSQDDSAERFGWRDFHPHLPTSSRAPLGGAWPEHSCATTLRELFVKDISSPSPLSSWSCKFYHQCWQEC